MASSGKPARVGALIIHGMGDPAPDFAASFISDLRTRLGVGADAVAFEPCFWSDLLQPYEDRAWQRLARTSGELRWRETRQRIISALGDPVGYLSGYLQNGHPVFLRVHERIRSSLERLETRLVPGIGAPLMILAHSLGTVVATNYLWNEERAAGEVATDTASPTHANPPEVARHALGATPFQQLATCASLITFGSNIPLFVPPVDRLQCVAFPRPGLAPKYGGVAKWINVYDPDDILGYPLAQLWDELNGTTIIDTPMDVGPWPISATPLSHEWYMRSDPMQALVVGELHALLDAAAT